MLAAAKVSPLLEALVLRVLPKQGDFGGSSREKVLSHAHLCHPLTLDSLNSIFPKCGYVVCPVLRGRVKRRTSMLADTFSDYPAISDR